MINTYESYLEHPAGHVLRIEDALTIYGKMAQCIEQIKMPEKMEYWNDCLSRAAEYNKIRNDWERMSVAEKQNADQERSLIHDGFIMSLNILSRIAEKEGLDNSWRGELGEERKRIGDYACFVAYITGISNR